MQGTGLAFIAFTEAMTHFPASPFWSVMFFLMLINLGLGSMIGTMAGITTPIIDTFKVPKEMFTGKSSRQPLPAWWAALRGDCQDTPLTSDRLHTGKAPRGSRWDAVGAWLASQRCALKSQEKAVWESGPNLSWGAAPSSGHLPLSLGGLLNPPGQGSPSSMRACTCSIAVTPGPGLLLS